MQVYRMDLYHHIKPDGVHVRMESGKEVSVDGRTMVSYYGVITDDRATWFPTEREARASAAARLEEQASILMNRASSLRDEASHG